MQSDERDRPPREARDGRSERDNGERFGHGDWSRVYERFGDRVFRFCYRLSGDRTEAEDLAAETFLAAIQATDRFEGRCSPLTWLLRIALNRWRSALRKRRGGPAIEEIDPETEAGEDPIRARLEAATLEEAIDRLPEALRTVFILVKVEGLTYREAADALGVPQGTLQSRVNTAVCRLRADLGESEEPARAVKPEHRTTETRRANEM